MSHATEEGHSAEELSLTFDDIEAPFTRPVLEDRVEEIVDYNLVYRDAFRDYDATGINSNVVQIPVPDEKDGRPKIVDEGAEFPRSHEEYALVELRFDKFGFEVPITWEASEDSRLNLAQDQVDMQARDMARDINERAFEVIDGELGAETVGDANGTFTYDDLLEGRRELVTKSYNPDLLIADVDAVHDLLKSDNFLSASEMQGELRRSGAVGRIAGMDIVEDDSGLPLGGETNPGALMVDTSFFGYEGTRTPITTEDYEEIRTQTEVFRIFTRMGWLVTQGESGVIIEG